MPGFNMSIHIYPRGYSVVRALPKNGNTYQSCGSEEVRELVCGQTDFGKTAGYSKRAIAIAHDLFDSNFIGRNLNYQSAPLLSESAVEALGLLIDCVENDLDISELLETKALFVKPYPESQFPIFHSTRLSIEERYKNKDLDLTSANIIRCIIKNSDNGIHGLVKVLDYFFGWAQPKNDLSALKEAVAMKAVSSVKAIL